MIAPALGLAISIAAVVFGVRTRARDPLNGKLAIALGIVGIIFNLYALLRGL